MVWEDGLGGWAGRMGWRVSREDGLGEWSVRMVWEDGLEESMVWEDGLRGWAEKSHATTSPWARLCC